MPEARSVRAPGFTDCAAVVDADGAQRGDDGTNRGFPPRESLPVVDHFEADDEG
ncbi:hypothetical protein M3G03_05455 [Aestuariimicrobium sp. p3-SID1156]|uniref:hypothetical protein n=1 Tax=Aestuariimicrobium sp. p3-SID1156 TaxID=2916038 RepID=UPI00223BF2AC|nr:hypothetical protein [Aestuariimicrobium sp. p3-SID1156]MCT1458989.1 hypothetical protein [Aestuariimicrobium sp. p3-SID1156]